MGALLVLDASRARTARRVAEEILPGSGRVAPEVWIDAVAAADDHVVAALDVVGDGGTAFGLIRALVIEAWYGGTLAPGGDGLADTGWSPPAGSRVDPAVRWLPPAAPPVPETAGAEQHDVDVVVVGSGGGGGVAAAGLAEAGRSVVCLEAGGLHRSGEFVRSEPRATRMLWAPPRFAATGSPDMPFITLLAGRCVGGGTTINNSIALRARSADYERWGATGGPAAADLEPFYAAAEARLGVRERADWTPSGHTMAQGFVAIGASWVPVASYTDATCTKCGSCMAGCPTGAGKSALVSYVEPALTTGRLELRSRATVERVLIEDGVATGVEYRDPDGTPHSIHARKVVVAAGAIDTPALLLRSGVTSPHVGRNLGLHTTRIVAGVFDEPQDNHAVYHGTATCDDFASDADAPFTLQGPHVPDPVGFATGLTDAGGAPLSGAPLVAAMGRYRHLGGLIAMAGDQNDGAVDRNGAVTKSIGAADRRALDRARDTAAAVLTKAGASEILWTGPSSAHMQGSVRMGGREHAAVDQTGCSYDVSGLYVADASLIPATCTANPSLTVMALGSLVASAVHAALPMAVHS